MSTYVKHPVLSVLYILILICRKIRQSGRKLGGEIILRDIVMIIPNWPFPA